MPTGQNTQALGQSVRFKIFHFTEIRIDDVERALGSMTVRRPGCIVAVHPSRLCMRCFAPQDSGPIGSHS
ncbi:hypothetical protein XH91_09990 [Bradyrhizobium guangzhouense]|uniref:Uncharacterized protein n=1 Tax=Bradyrhizobium guangzhouense TaxID=1325095 RepID=A0AAE5WYZ1_9BRAD|nr:hypothetical protein XH91_09990 [Bradyrhizobium guangzhouense]